jgi:uncharacterized protein (DUF433 family)
MIQTADHNSTVVRTSRGLSIAGTRITLYALLDYFRDGWSPRMVQQWFGLTEAQMDDVIHYINAHREEVDQEYEEILKRSEENRRYWEDQQRRRQPPGASTEPSQRDSRREKLQAWKDKVSHE